MASATSFLVLLHGICTGKESFLAGVLFSDNPDPSIPLYEYTFVGSKSLIA